MRIDHLPRTPEENSLRLATLLSSLTASVHGRSVFLVDGDRTLTPDDTSRTFLTQAGGDHRPIKARFQREGYTFDSFRFHAQVHLDLADSAFDTLAHTVAMDIALHPGALAFLRRAAARASVFVVSAGIPRIWRALLDEHDLDEVGVIGGIEPNNPLVFGRAEKGQVARAFDAVSNCVVGVGDSDVDAEMLMASRHAVVVVNHHQNSDLIPHLTHHSSLSQVVPLGVPHSGVPLLSFEAIAELGHEIDGVRECR